MRRLNLTVTFMHSHDYYLFYFWWKNHTMEEYLSRPVFLLKYILMLGIGSNLVKILCRSSYGVITTYQYSQSIIWKLVVTNALPLHLLICEYLYVWQHLYQSSTCTRVLAGGDELTIWKCILLRAGMKCIICSSWK